MRKAKFPKDRFIAMLCELRCTTISAETFDFSSLDEIQLEIIEHHNKIVNRPDYQRLTYVGQLSAYSRYMLTYLQSRYATIVHELKNFDLRWEK